MTHSGCLHTDPARAGMPIRTRALLLALLSACAVLPGAVAKPAHVLHIVADGESRSRRTHSATAGTTATGSDLCTRAPTASALHWHGPRQRCSGHAAVSMFCSGVQWQRARAQTSGTTTWAGTTARRSRPRWTASSKLASRCPHSTCACPRCAVMCGAPRPAAQRSDVFFVSAAAGLRCWQVYKMCAPSRASVLSGRYPWHVGYYDNNGTRVC